MKVFSDYVWSSECGDSVLLKQVRQGKKTVVFGCVGANYLAGSYVLERLGVWFQKRGLELCLAGAGQKKIEQEIEELLVQTRQELTYYGRKAQEGQQKGNDISVVGFLAAGNCFWLIREGKQGCYLVNRRFNRPHAERLAGEEGVVSGILQRGVGILLCTGEYEEAVTEEMIKQCLSVAEIHREGQAGRRLKELQIRGSAVYLLFK